MPLREEIFDIADMNDQDSEFFEKHEVPKPSWRTLPRKGQLAILALGVLQGSFTVMQVFTSIMWGWLADRPYCGRKLALLIGLIGTGASCIAVGFSKTFIEAVIWRTLGGAINGTVGVSRTMLAENVKDKRYLPRAFLLLPMSFNFASFFGPVIGGWLVDLPSRRLLANEASWIKGYPYALPALLSAAILFAVAGSAMLWLDETLPGHDTHTILRRLFRREARYQRLSHDEEEKNLLRSLQRPSFANIWTANVVLVLIAVGFFDFHMGAFNGLWPVLLSSPRSNTDQNRSMIFFSDGLGMTPAAVGSALAILGAIGLVLQLSLYPRVHQRLGTLLCFRIFSIFFPLAYFCAPYIALIPASAVLAIWVCITCVLFLQILARTFSLPATILLINNCSPHPSVLATVHGVGQAVSAAARAVGPIAVGYVNKFGMKAGMIAFAWWAISIIAFLGWAASLRAKDGSTCQTEIEDEE